MKITCIALDLDRTTLNSQGRLSEKNRQAINSAIDSGIQIVVASGRALRSLPGEILDVKGIRYAVTSNGASVYDLHTGECLKQHKMTAASVEAILHFTEHPDVAYEGFINGKPYGQREYVEDPVRFGSARAAVPYVQRTREPVENIRAFLLEHREDLNSLDVVTGDRALKGKLWEQLNRNVPDIYITSSMPHLLEISHKESGKHSGTRFLLEYLGLSRSGLAAFGDGDNDAELLKFAACGIAVENASAICRAAADWITRSNDQDGVAYAIERILEANEKDVLFVL